MTVPEGFIAKEFFTPTAEQKADYYITGQDVIYNFSEKEYGSFSFVDWYWKEILSTKPPTVYHVFNDDNCWVTNWTTTLGEDFLDYRVAIKKDSSIFTDLVNEAKDNKVVII